MRTLKYYTFTTTATFEPIKTIKSHIWTNQNM